MLFTLAELPVFNNVLFASRAQAQAAPVGRLELNACEDCGLLYNRTFDPELVRYAPDYTNSLHHSEEFRSSAQAMADRLGAKTPKGSTVVEIGCGTAEFLVMVSEAVCGHGIGFDPSLNASRVTRSDSLELHRSEFSASAPDGTALVILQQVLEHVATPRQLLGEVRSALRPGALFYVDVPDAAFMIRERSYLDVIYEHPLYYRAKTLATLARAEGFCVAEDGRYFGEQFLWMDLAPTSKATTKMPGDHDAWLESVGAFGSELQRNLDAAARTVTDAQQVGPIVLWGAGSKGISLLNLLPEAGAIAAIVDINPDKWGRFTPLAGREVIGPREFTSLEPAAVLTTNRNYVDEIRQAIQTLGVNAEVLAV